MIFNINFNNLNFETQQEILDWVKKSLFDNLQEEAKEKGKTLQQLLWEDYSMDYEFNEKEKEEFFKTSLDNFLEEEAMKKIYNAFKNLKVEII
ncbi:MAG: hypothetical protein NC917_07100 [Candidatus Omnitrophica bacterium]|nr:hypothetical protein [Candidatus Omnitrophota bacterium]